MQLKPYLGMVLSALIICASSSALAQSAPDALERKYPLAAGVGFSGFNPDFDPGHVLGGTLWIDYRPPFLPWFLHGVGIEAEARDLNFGRSPDEPYNLRQDTVEGGVFYSWRHFSKLHPYGKAFGGYGNTDYGSNKPPLLFRGHDSRTIVAIGGGFDYRIFQKVWVRGDYEYQFWPDFHKHLNMTIPPGQLNPQGLTIGAMYHFNMPRAH